MVPFRKEPVKFGNILLNEFINPETEENGCEHVRDVMHSARYDQQHNVRKSYARNVLQEDGLSFLSPEQQTEEHDSCVPTVKIVAGNAVRNPNAGRKSGFVPIHVLGVRKLHNVLYDDKSTRKRPLMP